MAPGKPTIVALSSGALPSGVAVIRISGPATRNALERVVDALPPERRMVLRCILDPQTGELLDTGLVAYFPAPRSFTGEDCAELQVHGSRAVVNAILDSLVALPGVELADAGAFTRRAFENGKLDLAEIEGLGDLLAAETTGQRRQAIARAQGGLSTRIADWRESLVSLRAELEALLDFSDEGDVPEGLEADFRSRMGHLRTAIARELAGYERGRIVREGFRIALGGPPNAGKSSLLNALAGSEVAIVTAEAGTTRDTRDVALSIGGQLVLLVDTAGIRETESLAEAEGIRRARDAFDAADLVLWLSAPDVQGLPSPDIAVPVWDLATKTDLVAPAAGPAMGVSALTGDGIEALIGRIETHIAEAHGTGEPELISRLRDKGALEGALAALDRAADLLDNPELAAEELRACADVLARFLGVMDAEAVLDRLFSGFCIGK
ncbi:tRNA uridine-5-carboxymethylaminomethyl(34) synthesis GTPase MnmE [Pelagibacterium montanilacus]|uniref:tRNA uridine-5-carboxymethylaminomethyl(34) synthesis GTPase MnmE n=1 Tax=Pelagibacterium montanilacus TaxID=2185280 RepID=UPI000F8E7173|nr:tRNA uridine-5-carboxymethylaminomethyl(34) synthesis GTPase MnmE [Pelagibacterium montanilacus]